MRQIILTFLAASTAVAAFAHPISPGEAQSIASEFFNSGSGPKRAPKAVKMAPTDAKHQDAQPYYVFNSEGGDGFVIVSGDTRARKILGYSDKGTFSKEHMPPQLEWLLSEYEKSIDSIPVNAPTPRQNITRSGEQNYLLTTQWGQGEPYNAKCPFVDGGRAVTGCVATAMAQIINYENKTSHVAEIPEYWCATYMPTLPAYEFSYGHLDNDGIATLMLYCGQSVRMDYSPIESGSAVQDVPDALRNYFGWEPEVRTMERDKYNDEHWNRMVKEEISKGHPLLYSAVGNQGWHAFVVDGFSDDLFHVNWGWDGYMDGYYSFQPLAQDHKSDFINMQWMVAVRDDDPSADIITYGTTINGINYELMDDLTAVVLPLKDGNKYRGDLVIPSHVDFEGKTYTVNYFGPNAFVNCEHLESISIPATIIGHEWSIFDGCENLHKVNVEDMAAFIRLDVGGWWTGSPLTYGGDLYLNGELVKDLVIPEGIESVGYCKFMNCWSIESITMSSTMKHAGQYSFANCPNLRKVDMSNSAMEILGELAFVNSVSLEEISIPATVKTMEYNVFGEENGPGCKKLRKIVSLATTPPWCTDDDIFAELQHSDATLYVPDEAVEEYRTSKEWRKFLDIRSLSEEKPLPETDTITVGYYNYEINLTEKYATIIGKNEYYCDPVTIPAYIEYNEDKYPIEAIGYNGSSWMNISGIDAPLKRLGLYSLSNVSFESGIEIPSTLTDIARTSFRGSRMSSLLLPKEITSIGSEVFGFCEIYDELGNIGYEKAISMIESHNPNPPIICEDSFDPVTYAETPLKVPYGSRKAYASAIGWRNFANIINIGEEQEVTLGKDLTLSASFADNSAVRDKMPLKVSATVRNSGEQKVSGFKLSWLIDGKALGEKHYEVELQPYEIISLDEKIIASVDTSGKHELKLIISTDEADQDPSDNEVTLSFDSFDKGYYRVSLFEQFTTESCSLTTHHAPQIAKGIMDSGKSDFLAQVSHHCGFFDDFLTLNHDYEWFYNEGGGTYTPALMLNRTDINETGYTPLWGVPEDLDRRIIKQAGICDALVSVDCNVEGDKVIVKTLLEKNEEFNTEDGFNRVTVFLLEDSIPSREQLDTWSDGYATDYIHRNTVRKVMSGIWGDKIVWDGDVCALKYISDIDPEWNRDNLKAVAFIHRYNPESPIDCQVYTAGSSDLPQYGRELDDSAYKESVSYVSSVTLTPEDVMCAVGESFEIQAVVLPENAECRDLSWSSSNEEVAVVDSTGKVTGVGVGEATVTAAAMDGSGVNASCRVTVYSVPAESISINPEAYSGTVGETIALHSDVWPENATDRTVIWSSGDESVARITDDGNDTFVEIVGIGKVTISASIGEISGSFDLCCYPVPGDADWNGVINITDAVNIANYVVERKHIPDGWDAYEWEQFYVMGANVNGSPDNSITFADAYATVSLALEQPSLISPQHMPSYYPGSVETSVDALVIKDIEERADGRFVIPVALDNTIDYVALQADITLPEGMTIDAVELGDRISNTHTLSTRSIDDHSLRVAVFDIGNSAFSKTGNTVFELVINTKDNSNESIVINNVIAADKDAKECILSSGNSSSHVDVISDFDISIVPVAGSIHLYNAASELVVVATIDGSIVKSFIADADSENIPLPSGIYVVKVAGKCVKCVVR